MARTGSAKAGTIDLGDLAAPVAIHDLRAPLVGIVGLSEQLLTTDLDPAQRKSMMALAETARYALSMADDLAEIAHSQSGILTIDSKPVDLHALFLAGAALAGGRAEHKGLEFRVDAGPAPGLFVMTDKRRLSQIVVNLLDNAIKYTDEGSVGLSLCCSEIDDRIGLTIEISDTGPGIPEDQVTRLLEPYSRGEDAGSQRGLGLGLHVTALMVDALGGHLRFEPAPGGGTRAIVDLDLPLAPVSAQDKAAPADETPSASNRASGHVLVVDDNRVNRQLMETILHQLGYDVTLANSGAEALRLLDTTAFEAILVDYEMPDMNGVETAAAIRALPDRAGIPLLAVSAHRGGLPPNAPADLYDAAIEKPISIPAVKAALDAAVSAAPAAGGTASGAVQAG